MADAFDPTSHAVMTDYQISDFHDKVATFVKNRLKKRGGDALWHLKTMEWIQGYQDGNDGAPGYVLGDLNTNLGT